MSTQKASGIDDERLECYLDGELAPHEVTSLESELRDDADARERLEILRTFERGIRGGLDARVAQIPEGALWARIEAGLPKAATGPTWIERLRAWFAVPAFELKLSFAATGLAAAVVIWMIQSPEAPVAAPEATLAAVSESNAFVVESYEVSRGTVVIDVPPDDPTMPAVVWYFDDEPGADPAGGPSGAAPKGEG